MKKLIALFLLTPAIALAGYPPPVEYGVATTITFDLYNTDGTLDVDEVDGGAEVTLYCDEAAGVTATNDFVDEGPYYSLALTAAELQCARLVVSVGATDTNNIHIWTVGNVSAQVDDDGGWFDAIPWNAAWDAEAQSEATDALNAYDPPTDTEMDTQFADIDTAIGVGGAGLTAVPYNAAWDAEIQSEAADALVAIDLDHLLNVDYDPATPPGTATALLNELIESDAGVSRFTTNALEQAPSGGGGGGLTAIASGTAQSATGTTLVLAASETFANDELIGAVVQITGGTAGVGQTKCITDNVGSTDTVTVNTWTTTPTGTITYEIAPSLGDSCSVDTPTIATAVVDEWETQSLADPTGFRVNVIEVGGTAQTANDNGADINAVLNDTDDIGVAGAGLTAVPWNAAWDAEVESEVDDSLGAGTGTSLTGIPWTPDWDVEAQSEVNDALVAVGLDHLVSAAVVGTDVTDNSIVARLVSDDATADWDSYNNTTDGFEALRNRGDAAWITGAGGTPPQLLQTTTIATLATQTSFTLTAGSADNDAYNSAIVVVTDASTATQKAVGTVSDYVGSTRTVTLGADPGIFTMAVGDTIDVIAALGSSSGGGGDATAANQTTILNRLGTPADLGGGATVAGNLTDIEGQTDDIGAAGAGLTEAGGTGDQFTAVPYNSAWSANIRAAIGLATANMDAQLSTIDQNVDDIEGATILASGTCDSGTTSTCVDAALTQANDFWQGAGIVFISGNAAGETSCVYDFVAATDTLTFWATQTNINTEGYLLISSPMCESADNEGS